MNTSTDRRRAPVHIRQQEVQARAALADLERRARAKADLAWMEGTQTEILAQAKRRHAVIAQAPRKPAEGPKPLRIKTGLQWLFERKRLTTRQLAAGVRYGKAVALAESPSLKSCVAGMEARVDFGSSIDDTRQLEEMAARTAAARALASARITGLRCHAKMIAVCDAVCGRGETVRQFAGGDRDRAERHEAELSIALDLLADHWSLPTVAEPPSEQ